MSQRTPRTAPRSFETAAIQIPGSVSAPRQTPGAEAALQSATDLVRARSNIVRRSFMPPALSASSSLGPQVFSNSHGCWLLQR
jgi:hypothetical protein